MKPLFLKMTAFGPFSESVGISFDRVFDGGLFLIHGRTGAGKTSILDGICFSLFGRPSSEEREKDLSTIRSDLASANLMTECELIFTIGTTAYRVHRIPTQNKPKKRGEGVTEHKGSAELYRFNGTVPELRASLGHDESQISGKIASLEWQPLAGKLEAVNVAVEALIGMNERQFRQIIVLPQGRFREFLSSSSTERQAILEKLFQTDRFSKFQTAMAAKSRILEAKLKDALQSFSSKLANRGLATIEEIEPKLTEQKTILETSRRSLELRRADVERLDRELNRAFEFSKTTARKIELENQALAANSKNADVQLKRNLVARNRAWAPYFETALALGERTSKAETLTQSKIEIEKVKVDLERRKTEFQIEIAVEREKSPTLEEMSTERTRLRDSAIKLKEIESLRKDIATFQMQMDQVSKESSKLSENKLALLNQCLIGFSGLLAMDESLQSAEMEFLKSEEHRISSLELRYHQNEVFKISKKLEKGNPCPVCGSTDHPRLAHENPSPKANAASVVVTSESIAQERATFDRAKLQNAEKRSLRKSQLEPFFDDFNRPKGENHRGEKDAETSQDFQTEFKKWTALRQELTRIEKSLEARDIETQTRTETKLRLAKSVEEKLSELPVEDHVLEKVMSRGMELKSEQDRREKRISELVNSLARTETELSHATGKLSALNDELKRTAKEVNELAKRKVDAETAALDKVRSLSLEVRPPEIPVGDRELSALEAEISLFDTSRARIAAALEEVAKTLGAMDPSREASAIDVELTQARKAKGELEASVARLSVDIEDLEKLLAESRSETEQLEHLKTESERASRVSALLLGDRSQNKLMVPLARFVLQSRFEDVLDQANRRLAMMSRGQFQLRRPALSGNLRDSQGLELTVEDSIAGKERHAGSLSGGESFMAALALALGLADVVQSDLGGLRLDSVLIDEGFGTLDSESLDLALRTLIDLQTGGRFVGIISHVQELKNQVPVQLEVIKSPTGSWTRWNETSFKEPAQASSRDASI